MQAAAMDREWSQFQIELALHQGYSMLLARELRVAYLPIETAPEILGQGPIIPPFEQRYMPVPPGPSDGQGSFAQALGPSYGPGYAPTTLDGTVPSTGPFAGGDDSDDGDTNQFIGGEDSQQSQIFVVA